MVKAMVISEVKGKCRTGQGWKKYGQFANRTMNNMEGHRNDKWQRRWRKMRDAHRNEPVRQ